jgi:hypothetical protein
MCYIIDTETHLRVARFSDDQWEEATKKLAALRRKHGNHFKLLDH